MRPERDRAAARSLPDATTAAATSMAVSRPAPIAHHQKKTNTDAISRPSPSPTAKAPILAAHGRRPSAASNRSRRCHRPPARSASPPNNGTRATTSISANPCPGLIGTNTGPSSRAGTANNTKARTNRIAHPCSHLIVLRLPQLRRDDGEHAHCADLTGGGRCQSAAPSRESLATRLASTWTGLTHRPSWYRRRQVGVRSFSPAVPSACHSERDATGLPRSTADTSDRLTSAPSTTGARQHEW
jgi:hypothetical protein